MSKRKNIDDIDSNDDREFNQVITINSLLIFMSAAGIITGQADKKTDIPQVRSCAPEHPDVQYHQNNRVTRFFTDSKAR
ncbi:MAG: hypothetical protein ACTS85_01250 [Arsenophonus sp. NC-PG7-MAG3]